MSTSSLVAKHFHDVFFGGNWADSNVETQLKDVSWQEAVQQVHDLNTIATLTYHIGYFVNTVLNVLKGGPLEGNDKLSFDHPPIESEEDWDKLRLKVLKQANEILPFIESLPADKWDMAFVDRKHNNYFYNLVGIIEHTHYHLGQIALIKKVVRSGSGG